MLISRSSGRTSWRKLLVCVFLFALGCSDGKGRAELGSLVEILSPGVASRDASKSWKAASQGQKFYEGEAVRTDASGSANVIVLGQSLRMYPQTTLVFGEGDFELDGTLELADSDKGLRLGILQMTTTGRLLVSKSGDDLRMEVLLGRAEYIFDGDARSLEQGESTSLRIKSLRLGEITLEEVASDAGPTSLNAGVSGDSEDDAVPVDSLEGWFEARGPGNTIAGKGARKGRQAIETDMPFTLGRRGRLTIGGGERSLVVRGPASGIMLHGSENLVKLDRGDAQATATDASLSILVAGGRIVITPAVLPAEVTVSARDGNARVDVDAGEAQLLGKGEARLALGESGVLQASGAPRMLSERAEQGVISMPINSERATVHDPNLPTHLRLLFTDHCEQGVVEVAGKRGFRNAVQRRLGAASVVLRLGAGSHRYRLRCVLDGKLAKSAAAEGIVRVDKSSGTQPLPLRAQQNHIAADGRDYFIQYQNHLPILVFKWPSPPSASSYQLMVQKEGESRVRTIKLSSASHTFASGKLPEARYRFHFEGGGKRSATSTVTISFDNLASSAHISTPSPGAELSGKRVRAAGSAASGWAVFAGGTRLKLDGQRRFNEMVPLTTGGAMVLRFSHPRQGNHFYVRR